MPYHSYIFFDTEPGINVFLKKAVEKEKREFIARIEKSSEVRTRSYATLALKGGTRFMLNMNAATPDAIQLLVRDLLRTPLGAHLRVSRTLLGTARASQYNPKSAPKESSFESKHRYLVVYPFTKTVEWHLLPFEERRNIMKEHIDVGRKYSAAISQLLLYSFGIDDHEFIVSYQMDDLAYFQTLVMELRGTEARRYTKNDTPIFTCIRMPFLEMLEML